MEILTWMAPCSCLSSSCYLGTPSPWDMAGQNIYSRLQSHMLFRSEISQSRDWSLTKFYTKRIIRQVMSADLFSTLILSVSSGWVQLISSPTLSATSPSKIKTRPRSRGPAWWRPSPWPTCGGGTSWKTPTPPLPGPSALWLPSILSSPSYSASNSSAWLFVYE